MTGTRAPAGAPAGKARSGKTMSIGGRLIGVGEPLFVIAEIGLNHQGSVGRALSMVDAAAAAGASAVKLQTLFADELMAAQSLSLAHVSSESLREFFRRFELDEAAHRAVAERAHARGLAMLATPFSERAVELLQRVGVDGFKIASGDLTWDGLIERVAATGKPMVVSTGMAAMNEVSHAVAVARLAGASEIALLHCVSAYPVPRGSENLRALLSLAAAFDVPVGLSDHGEDAFAVPMAVALGASLYERHLVLASGDGSVDAAVSSTPDQLSELVDQAARARSALGTGRKACLAAESVNRPASRRGLYASRTLPRGHVVSDADVVALRPAAGLGAERQRDLVGARLARTVLAGQPFTLDDCGQRGRPERKRYVA